MSALIRSNSAQSTQNIFRKDKLFNHQIQFLLQLDQLNNELTNFSKLIQANLLRSVDIYILIQYKFHGMRMIYKTKTCLAFFPQ